MFHSRNAKPFDKTLAFSLDFTLGGGGALAKPSQIQREVFLPTHLPHSHSLLLLYQLLAFLSFLTTSTHPSSWRNLPRRKQNCTEHPLIVATEACIYWTIMWSSQKLNRQGIVKWWSHTFNDWFDIDPWLGNIPWRREWLSGPLFLPGEFHGQRSLVGYNPRVRKRDRHDGATNTFTTFTFLAQLPTRRERYGSCSGAQD